MFLFYYCKAAAASSSSSSGLFLAETWVQEVYESSGGLGPSGPLRWCLGRNPSRLNSGVILIFPRFILSSRVEWLYSGGWAGVGYWQILETSPAPALWLQIRMNQFITCERAVFSLYLLSWQQLPWSLSRTSLFLQRTTQMNKVLPKFYRKRRNPKTGLWVILGSRGDRPIREQRELQPNMWWSAPR